MKPLMILCSGQPLYPSGMPFFLYSSQVMSMLSSLLPQHGLRGSQDALPEFPSAQLPEVFCCLWADVLKQFHLDASYWLPSHGHVCMQDMQV